MVEFRNARLGDVDALLDVEERAAVIAFAHVFPQDSYAFPMDLLRRRWTEEINDPATGTYLAVDGTAIVGFAATRGAELLHFGTALEQWGNGLAHDLHDWTIDRLRADVSSETAYLHLRVLEENARARRFYEKHGWRHEGTRTRSPFEPHPVLVEYRLPTTIRDRLANGLCGGDRA